MQSSSRKKRLSTKTDKLPSRPKSVGKSLPAEQQAPKQFSRADPSNTVISEARASPAGIATPPSKPDYPTEGGHSIIGDDGDVVLEVVHVLPDRTARHSFRVISSHLKASSRYFDQLLSAGRFGEGELVKQAHETFAVSNENSVLVPLEDLPIVRIENIGRISSVKSIVPLLSDFFNVLHGKDIRAVPLVGNMANLAIVADRFSAIDTLKSYVFQKKLIRAIDGKTTPKHDAVLTEEKTRQRVLVGLLLDYPDWVARYTSRLITKGWLGYEAEVDSPQWWDLPQRIEEELMFRRRLVLETVQSLQTYFLDRYTTRERQCKLGYDSSAQCDSFQLGEMVTFFSKTGLLKLQPTLSPPDESLEPYQDDINVLIDTLRQVPEYQIDRNHSHCGIRTRMTPLLDIVQVATLHIGICGYCWQTDRHGTSWMNLQPHAIWSKAQTHSSARHCPASHVDVRPLFHASQRFWTDDAGR